MTDETVTVPADHEVGVIRLPFEATVMRTPGGAIVASLGSASDDADRELETVLANVERELAMTPTMVNVVAETGRVRMADLFAPAQPKLATTRSPITWCFHAGAVASLMASPGRRRMLFEQLHRIAQIPIMQTACVIDGATPAVVAFVKLAYGLGLDVRQPDTSQGGMAVFIEVKRPGGEIVSVVAGHPLPPQIATAPDTEGELARLESKALIESVDRVTGTEPVIAYRSPRLLQVMLDAQARGDATGRIMGEMLARELPVFSMRMQSGLELRNFNGERAIPIYADATAVQWAAVDLGKPRDSYEPAPMDLRALLGHAAKSGLGIAIGLYRDRKMPMYAVVPASAVAGIAQRT